MNKKSWLVIGVVVLVALGIYYNSGVGLSPFDLKESSDASEKTCGSYDLVSSLDKNSLEDCTTNYWEKIVSVAQRYFSNIETEDSNHGGATRSVGENCVGDANVDGVVNQGDIDAVFDNWGKCSDCDADVHPENEGNEIVNSDDLLLVLSDFGCTLSPESDGYIITGKRLNSASLILANLEGNEVWHRSSSAYSRKAVQKTEDGGYVFIESESPTVSSLVKTNSVGEIEWSKPLSEGDVDRRGVSVQKTEDGGYVLIGTEKTSDSDRVASLIKTNSVGEIEWSRAFEAYEQTEAIQQTSEGGYVFLASKVLKSYLVKTNSVGEIEWSKTYGISGSFWDWLKDLKLTSDGGHILVGVTYEINSEGAFSAAYLVKTNSEGIEEWIKTYGREEGADPGSLAKGNSVQQTEDGGYVFVGTRRFSSDDDFEAYLVKTNSEGIEEWSQTFGGNFASEGKSVQQTEDGGYVFVGGYWYIYLVKTNSEGIEEWSQTFGGSGAYDYGNSVQIIS